MQEGRADSGASLGCTAACSCQFQPNAPAFNSTQLFDLQDHPPLPSIFPPARRFTTFFSDPLFLSETTSQEPFF